MSEIENRLDRLTPEQRALLGAMLRGRATPGVPPSRIPRRPATDRRPLSFAQERFWFLDRLTPGSAVYTYGAHYRVDGPVDAAALERSLVEVLRRHEVLRARIEEVDGEPVQSVGPVEGWSMTEVHLEALPSVARDDEAARLVARESRRRFDLGRDPLLQATLIHLGPSAHLLLLTVHHIAADGWSMGVLSREVSDQYRAFVRGAPSPLARLPIQYADFAAWERERLTGDALRAPLAYWRARLRGAPPALDLPRDRPRSALPSLRSGKEHLTVGDPLRASVVALGKAHGATLFMTLLSAFLVLLHRYSAEEDIVVGCPVAGRGHTDTEALIGLFINTLVLRADLSGDPSFAEVLRRVRGVVIDAFAHQDLPFARLVEELRPARSLGVAPLFQVAFILQNATSEAMALDGASITPLPFDNGTIDLDLAFELIERPDGLAGTLRYDAALFDAATVARLLAHYRAILEEATADPATPISRLRLLSPAERVTALSAWNRTEAAYPQHLRVDALVRAQAARSPGAIAVSHAGEVLTYGALEARARLLARRLAELGAGPGALVAVYLDRSPAMVAALLGALWAGCGYVPLDPEYPAERTAFVLADAGAFAVLTERRLLPTLPAGDARILLVDETPASAAEILDAAVPVQPVTSADVAYVIYTSGSTGRPKGVAVTHRNVVNFLTHMARSPGLGAADVLVAVTTLSFDIAGLELWLPLVTGARIELCDRRTAMDGAALSALLERSGCTVMQATPATWRLLVEAGWRGGAGFKALCGGEALAPDLAQALVERAGSVYNLYGPTETTIWSTVQRLDGAGLAGGVAIGRPIANTQVYVLDRHREPVPTGVPGELYIGGDGVAVGYRNRPDLTRERFVPDPFRAEARDGARMYRTGDRGRHRADGTLEHLGRLDDQIKLRGYRIEPGEIEAVLCRQPEVRDAAVTAREHAPGDVRLCAYVVALTPPPPAELRSALEAELPAHMIPSAFVFLDRLPRTPNGKLDRRALPAPGEARPESGSRQSRAEPVAPRTPFEERLAAIWAEVLGAPRVGVTDDFFDLGGHSLLAMRVLARVRDAFKVDPTLQSFFRAPTVRALAGHLEGLSAAADELPLAPRGGAAPELSFAQLRFWFLERFEPGTALYHIPFAVRLQGRLDLGALQRALDAVVGRHEVLRTALLSTQDGGVPVIRRSAAVPLGVVPAPAGAGRTPPEAQRLLEEHARVPFDLAAGMMLRVTVVELGDDDHAALFLFHHIAADGWSLDVFFRELGPLYDAFSAGEPAPALPRLTLQYADFAAWQRRLLAGGMLDVQLAYWKKQLAGAPASLDLPLDAPRPAVLSVRGAMRSAELPRELLTSLHALARQAGATLFVTLLAAFSALLSRLSGQDDVCVGTPVAGRTRLETENLVGPFVNTLVIRGDLSGDPSFLELCARVREATLLAYANQDVPFERLVEALAPARSTGRAPLFQVLFVLQNAERAPLALRGLEVAPLAVDTGIAKLDLTLWMREHEDGLGAVLEYNTDLFQPATVDRLLGQLELVLRGAALRPGAPIGELPLLPGGGKGRRSLPVPAPAPTSPSAAAPRVAPGNALEAELVALWEQVLSVRPIGVRDDFFALGGHSLLAARLFDQIERAMGEKLPIAILFQAPTVERLADVLRRRGWSAAWSSLVAIQPDGSRPPFFCVHAVGGNILNYQLLSRHLGPEQPFYALQSQGLDGGRPPHHSVEEAAAHYLREIRTVQPRGPYHLGGSSSGGIVAFEMAQQLVAAGEEIGLLALVDTQILTGITLPGARLAAPGRRLALLADWHVGQLLLKPTRDWPAYMLERARDKARVLVGRTREDAPPTDVLRRVQACNRRALEAYVPRVYPGQVTMLLSEDEPFRAFHDLRLAWSRFAEGGLVIRYIPGDHEHTLDEPFVGHVAAELRALLERCAGS